MLRELCIYLLGGVTFIPLCILLLNICDSLPEPPNPPLEPRALTSDDEPGGDTDALRLLAETEKDRTETASIRSSGSASSRKALFSWLIVRPTSKGLPRKSDAYFARDGSRIPPNWRHVAPSTDNPATSSTDGTVQRTNYMSMMYRNIRGAPTVGPDIPQDTDGDPAFASDTSHAQDEHGIYFAILSKSMLYLYNSDDAARAGTECIASIHLPSKRVSMWEREVGDVEGAHLDGEKKPICSDGTLFTKRNAIHIASMQPGGPQWYIMTPRAKLLEDWYHALVDASSKADMHWSDLINAFDMRTLIATLDDHPDELQLRWLNALLGRVFLAASRTHRFQEFVESRILRRLQRMSFPRLLSDVQLNSVDTGHAAPTFGRPVLKSLTHNGHTDMEVHVRYHGRMHIEISATLTIPLGQRFKSYRVPVVLAVILRSLEGTMQLEINPPPSNRIWYGFTSMPKMDIVVEPVVSTRRVRWSLITGLIENRIRESVAESLVVPHMNSVSFFNTQSEARRGGIWNEALVQRQEKLAPVEKSYSTSPTLDVPLNYTPSPDTPISPLENGTQKSLRRRTRLCPWLVKQPDSALDSAQSNTDFSLQNRDLPERSLSTPDAVLRQSTNKSDSQPTSPDVLAHRTYCSDADASHTPLRARVTTLAKSLQDKDTRQTATKDAKDALKRGWATWSTRLADTKTKPADDQRKSSVSSMPPAIPPRVPAGTGESKIANIDEAAKALRSTEKSPAPVPSETLPLKLDIPTPVQNKPTVDKGEYGIFLHEAHNLLL